MKIFILLNAVVFLTYGLGFMFFPNDLSFYVTDTVPTTESGLIDMRATYGGMSLGFGMLLVLMSRNSKLYPIGTMASIIIVGGMALGRIVGMIEDGSPNTMMYIYLALEVVVVMIGFVLFLKSERIEAEE